MNTIPRKLGRYLIVREVGRGAMGVVYKAHDPVIEREVAIKAIHLNFQVTEEEKALYLSRFYREAKAAGKLNHPGIVTIYDVDEDKEQSVPFIVMEFLEGTTLQEFTSSGTRLPVENIRSIMTQMADALSYAHEHGIVHRDVKSANILILPGVKAKITDFGIARLPSSDLTRSGQFIGTPNYMSPEQIEGKTQVDGRSDLFSLGVIFYMLLTGERPFLGDSFNTVAYKIVNIDPLPPSALNPEVPAPYNRILMKLLAKDPDARYASGRDLIQDLQRINDAPMEILSKGDSTSSMAASSSENDINLAAAAKNAAHARPRETESDPAMLIDRPVKKSATFVVIGVLVAALLAAGILLYKSESPQSITNSAKSAPPFSNLQKPSVKAAAGTQNDEVRALWDLAMNYHQNGLYDKSMEKLNEILALDPTNTDALKYVDIITREKEAKEKKNEPAIATSGNQASATPAISSKTRVHETAGKISSRKKSAKAPPVAVSEPSKVPIDFVVEHSFPSGVLNIYLENKLMYTAELHGSKKKVLLFNTYQGKTSGTLELPPRHVVIQVQLICPEQNVSAVKQTTADLKEGDHRILKIRYVKASKQLDIKWS